MKNSIFKTEPPMPSCSPNGVGLDTVVYLKPKEYIKVLEARDKFNVDKINELSNQVSELRALTNSSK